MKALTARQRAILEFIGQQHRQQGVAPSFQEIARHFGFRSLTTVADHLRLLRRKGALAATPGQARSLRVVSALQALRRPVADIPLYGSIPAGFAENRQQEAAGCVSVDMETLGLKSNARTFALEVRGDSMIGRHIVEGDIVVLEHGAAPRNGDVVAALIDNESTLKTFVLERGQPWLRAENPRYPKMVPAGELVIQGVMVALIRKRK
jgi:repressor LexA